MHCITTKSAAVNTILISFIFSNQVPFNVLPQGHCQEAISTNRKCTSILAEWVIIHPVSSHCQLLGSDIIAYIPSPQWSSGVWSSNSTNPSFRNVCSGSQRIFMMMSYERHGVSNHRNLDCLFICLFRLLQPRKHQRKVYRLDLGERASQVTDGIPSQRVSYAVLSKRYHGATR